MMIYALAAYSFYANWAGWIPICLMATMVAILFNAGFLMFARAFSIKELERFAESEVMQALATGVMATMLVLLVDGTQQLIYSSGIIHGTVVCGGKVIQTGASNETIFRDTLDVARCGIQEKAKSIAQQQGDVMSSSVVAAEFNAMNTQLSIMGVTIFRGDWVSSWFKTTEQARIINNLATVLLIGLNAVSFLFLYVKNNALALFLPLGIVLRSFFLTRAPGAFLMSLAIGLYFLFPIFYILLDPTFIPTPLPIPSTQLAQGANLCYPTFSSAIRVVSTAQSAGATGGTLNMNTAHEELTKAYASLLLHPLIALFLTLVFVRYLMTILGADTYELTKLVTKVI